MRVAILTYHFAHNYGAVLQAFALQSFLRAQNVDVDILDYRALSIRNSYAIVPCFDVSVTQGGRLARLWKWCRILGHWVLREIPMRIKRRRMFQAFVDNFLVLSPSRYDVPLSNDNAYDIYIVGSDQVWNPRLTCSFDDVYWGNFETRSGAIKVSYAASMPSNGLTEAQWAYVRSSLQNNFSHVSVRERALATLLKERVSVEADVCLDPTLLVDPEVWERISATPKISRKYVLVYALTCRDDAMAIAKKIAGEIGAVVFEIVPSVQFRRTSSQLVPTPDEFVGLFRNAEFVVSESFHGTAFSIVFRKPFLSISRGTCLDQRQMSLLKDLDLIGRLIAKDARPSFSSIDYDSVEKRLQQLRVASAGYLKQILIEQEEAVRSRSAQVTHGEPT